MRPIIACAAAISFLAVSGCNSTPVSQMTYTQKKQVEKEVADRCTAQGYGPNSPERGACIQQEASREVSTRQERHDRLNSGVTCFRSFNTMICD